MLCASFVNNACHVYYCYCLATVLCVGLVNSVCHVLLLLFGDHLHAGLIDSVYDVLLTTVTMFGYFACLITGLNS